MVAGASLPRALPCRLRISDYEQRLRAERRACGVTRAENLAVTALRAMDGWGWRLIEVAPAGRPPQPRPATERAVELVAIGPGGVLVLDVVDWADPDVVEGRLHRGRRDAQHVIESLCRRTDRVAELVCGAGLAPIEVLPVLVLVGQRGTNLALGRVTLLDDNSVVPWAVARGQHLDDTRVRELADLLEAAVAPGAPRRTPVAGPPAPPDEAETAQRHGRHAESPDDEPFDAAALEQAVLSHAVTRPVEPWMAWLHPDQLRLVRRRATGASRIRGAAGTGKTVVALHRAAYLADAVCGPILFTTFVTTLPPVLAGLYSRLSPGTADRVEFTDLHAWAAAFLVSRGHELDVDPDRTDAAFALAWARGGVGSPLSDAGVTEQYCREEIDSVIKGRGITEFAEYADLRRVGRRIRLTGALREAVWAVHTDYQNRLEEAGLTDPNDLLALARAELRDRPLDTPYAAVIADEVQDLNCLAVRLLADIAADGERLLLIGDGQQQIYPGGYTLAEAGISVTGRSTVLQVNYRNPAEIVRSALELVADEEWNDLEDANEPGAREVTTTRTGGAVEVEHVASDTALRDAVVRRVWDLLEAGHEAAGIAVLCTTSGEAAAYAEMLLRCGLPVLTLDRYTGAPQQAIKIGTVKRAKGLEFADVIHPVPTRAAAGPDADAGSETRTLTMRTRYVAMTRARESVWLGSIA